jgi:CelD/BcsL family acetyltransferase involved in cellulose biosynthesis
MTREKNAEIRTYTTEDNPDWAAVIRDLAEVERHSWLIELHGDVRFIGEPRQRFWQSVLSPTHGSTTARVWLLYWDQKPVAFTFNLDSGPCRYYVAGHYAEHASAYSPGAILMRYTIKDAIERGLSIVDMGGGDPGYKAYWGSRPEEPMVGCLALPPGIKGFLMHHGIAGGITARDIVEGVLGKLTRFRGNQPEGQNTSDN